jgi:4-hydroxybutyrate CoA-transferase
VRTERAADVVRRIAAGSRMLATPSCATPETLLRAVGEAAGEIPGWSLRSGLLLGDQPYLPAVDRGELRFATWHVVAGQRAALAAGRMDYVPMRAGDIPGLLPGTFDVLLLRIPPPAKDGTANLGPSTSWTQQALAHATTVIAEIDPGLPTTVGDTVIPSGRIDAFVDAETPTCRYESAATTPVSDRIARNVLELLPRAVTLQVGIGAVPETLVRYVVEADLGDVSLVGMGCDAMVPLLDSSRNGPVLRSLELMGTEVLMSAADSNPAIEMIPSTQCHDPRWLATLDRFVSVNSAVEIDLGGQVASETVGGQVIAGVGGSFDFFQGAAWSPGGMRVVALQSTTPNGKISKIVPRLAEGTPVTIPRHTVDVVVTEYGVARLAGRSMAERAEALIAIAHPAFRDELADAVSDRRP